MPRHGRRDPDPLVPQENVDNVDTHFLENVDIHLLGFGIGNVDGNMDTHFLDLESVQTCFLLLIFA